MRQVVSNYVFQILHVAQPFVLICLRVFPPLDPRTAAACRDGQLLGRGQIVPYRHARQARDPVECIILNVNHANVLAHIPPEVLGQAVILQALDAGPQRQESTHFEDDKLPSPASVRLAQRRQEQKGLDKVVEHPFEHLTARAGTLRGRANGAQRLVSCRKAREICVPVAKRDLVTRVEEAVEQDSALVAQQLRQHQVLMAADPAIAHGSQR